MVDWSNRQRYLDDLAEQGIQVTFYSDIILDRMIMFVRKGQVEIREVMDMVRYYDDVYYDNTIRKVVRKVENAFKENKNGGLST